MSETADNDDDDDDTVMAMETEPSAHAPSTAAVPTATTEKSKPQRWIAVHPVRYYSRDGGAYRVLPI
jgi:hypothetical protein